jgi:hypothetical protein
VGGSRLSLPAPSMSILVRGHGADAYAFPLSFQWTVVGARKHRRALSLVGIWDYRVGVQVFRTLSADVSIRS